jgi:hypothetical protein
MRHRGIISAVVKTANQRPAAPTFFNFKISAVCLSLACSLIILLHGSTIALLSLTGAAGVPEGRRRAETPGTQPRDRRGDQHREGSDMTKTLPLFSVLSAINRDGFR